MDINILKDQLINWESVPDETFSGVSGFVVSKAVTFENFRIRQLSFSENYEADHWCEKGHVIYVIDGELLIEYKDQPSVFVSKGSSLILGDNISWHKAKTRITTLVLIID